MRVHLTEEIISDVTLDVVLEEVHKDREVSAFDVYAEVIDTDVNVVKLELNSAILSLWASLHRYIQIMHPPFPIPVVSH